MIDLQPFCHVPTENFCRPDVEKPFNHGTYTYATNGHILVRVPLQPEYADNKGPNPEKLLPRLEHGQSGPLIPIPAYETIPGQTFEREPCSECKGSGKLRTCQKCGASGSVPCGECGEDKPCPDNCTEGAFRAAADATGDDIIDCDECDGTGKGWAKQDIPEIARFEAHDFDTKYIAMIACLPNVRVHFGEAAIDWQKPGKGALAFVFDGGEGLIMPLRRDVPKAEAKQEVTA